MCWFEIRVVAEQSVTRACIFGALVGVEFVTRGQMLAESFIRYLPGAPLPLGQSEMVGGDEDRRAGAFQAYAQADSTLLAALQETPSCRAKFVKLVAKPVTFWIILLLKPLDSFGFPACCHGGLFRSRSDSHTSVPSLSKGTSWLLAG